jgi:hypothetical protein
MRRALGVVGVVAVLAALGLARGAEAGVTYGMLFRSTDILGNALPGSGAGTTHLSLGLDAAQACDSATGAGCPVLDVLLVTDLPLIAASVSLEFDPNGGLEVLSTVSWFGQGVVFNAMGNPTVVFEPMAPGHAVSCGFNRCSSFGGAIMTTPNAPPSLPAGTYHIGTVVWDTNAAIEGAHSIVDVIYAGLDVTGAVVNGNVVDVTGSETLQSGTLSIVPEPSTAALLCLGLLGTLVAARRRRRA